MEQNNTKADICQRMNALPEKRIAKRRGRIKAGAVFPQPMRLPSLQEVRFPERKRQNNSVKSRRSAANARAEF